MIKKIIAFTTFATISLTPSCSSYIYTTKYEKEIAKHHTCQQAETYFAQQDPSQEEQLIIRKTLAECYLNSAWLELSAINQSHDKKMASSFSSIDEYCRRADHHLTALIDEAPHHGNLSDLVEEYQFTCGSLLENAKQQPLEKRPFPGEVPRYP